MYLISDQFLFIDGSHYLITFPQKSQTPNYIETFYSKVLNTQKKQQPPFRPIREWRTQGKLLP